MKKHKASTAKQHRPSAMTVESKRTKEMRHSHRWRILSTRMRGYFPMCQHIDNDHKCDRIANTVHHIKQAETNPEQFYNMSNLIPLCNYHHAIVSQMERDNKQQQAIEMYSYWPAVIAEFNKGRI
jgi:5-methylcytosine-specific restriction endonuclease McrA